MLIDLSERSDQPELMDDFSSDRENLRAVFYDINRVNSLLGGSNITVNAVAELMKKNPQEDYTIVDMGCGDGNILRELAKYCRRHSIHVRLVGIDLNAEALELAKETSLGYPEIEYRYQDILELENSDLNCDIIINTLTMHHFVDKDVLIFLRKFNDLARIGVVINDLQRSRLAYYLFKVFSLIFIRTETAKIDGLISISKGFIKSELNQFTEKLTGVKHDIRWKWAFRYVWIMQPDRLKSI